MDSPKQNLCLAPDQKIVRTKKVANDQKLIWHQKHFWSVFVKKWRNLLFPRITYGIVFSTKRRCLGANQSGIQKVIWFSPNFLAWGDCMPLLYYKLPAWGDCKPLLYHCVLRALKTSRSSSREQPLFFRPEWRKESKNGFKTISYRPYPLVFFSNYFFRYQKSSKKLHGITSDSFPDNFRPYSII